MEQKLDTVVLVMGGLGLLEAHEDSYQNADDKAAGSYSVCACVCFCLLIFVLIVSSNLILHVRKQCVSLHLFLSKILSNEDRLCLLLCCSPHLDRETTGNKFLVRARLFLSDLIRMPSFQSYSVSCSPLSSSVTHPIPPHHKIPSVDSPHSCEDVQSHSSASSLTSLPLLSLPSTSSISQTSDPLGSRLSPEAILAEIAQLSRQNDLIKAQLSQARCMGSGVEGLPNSSTGQRRSSSGSTGRVTPQSVGERRSSVSSSTGKRSDHNLSEQVQAAEMEPTNQVRLKGDFIKTKQNKKSHLSVFIGVFAVLLHMWKKSCEAFFFTVTLL